MQIDEEMGEGKKTPEPKWYKWVELSLCTKSLTLKKFRPVGSITIYSLSMCLCIVMSVNNIAWNTVTFCPNQTIISAVSFTLMIYKHYHFISVFGLTERVQTSMCAGAQEGEIHVHIIKSSSSKPKPVFVCRTPSYPMWTVCVEFTKLILMMNVKFNSLRFRQHLCMELLSFSVHGKNFICHKTITSGWIALFKHRINSQWFIFCC